MRPPTVGDGAGTKLITLDTAFEDLPDVQWLRDTFPAATHALGSNDRDVQARMCVLGAGFAVLPTLLGDRTPGIERHDIDPAPPGRDVWLAYHQDLRGLARLRAFLDLVIECVGEGGAKSLNSHSADRTPASPPKPAARRRKSGPATAQPVGAKAAPRGRR